MGDWMDDGARRARRVFREERGAVAEMRGVVMRGVVSYDRDALRAKFISSVQYSTRFHRESLTASLRPAAAPGARARRAARVRPRRPRVPAPSPGAGAVAAPRSGTGAGRRGTCRTPSVPGRARGRGRDRTPARRKAAPGRLRGAGSRLAQTRFAFASLSKASETRRRLASRRDSRDPYRERRKRFLPRASRQARRRRRRSRVCDEKWFVPAPRATSPPRAPPPSARAPPLRRSSFLRQPRPFPFPPPSPPSPSADPFRRLRRTSPGVPSARCPPTSPFPACARSPAPPPLRAPLSTAAGTLPAPRRARAPPPPPPRAPSRASRAFRAASSARLFFSRDTPSRSASASASCARRDANAAWQSDNSARRRRLARRRVRLGQKRRRRRRGPRRRRRRRELALALREPARRLLARAVGLVRLAQSALREGRLASQVLAEAGQPRAGAGAGSRRRRRLFGFRRFLRNLSRKRRRWRFASRTPPPFEAPRVAPVPAASRTSPRRPPRAPCRRASVSASAAARRGAPPPPSPPSRAAPLGRSRPPRSTPGEPRGDGLELASELRSRPRAARWRSRERSQKRSVRRFRVRRRRP